MPKFIETITKIEHLWKIVVGVAVAVAFFLELRSDVKRNAEQLTASQQQHTKMAEQDQKQDEILDRLVAVKERQDIYEEAKEANLKQLCWERKLDRDYCRSKKFPMMEVE